MSRDGKPMGKDGCGATDRTCPDGTADGQGRLRRRPRHLPRRQRRWASRRLRATAEAAAVESARPVCPTRSRSRRSTRPRSPATRRRRRRGRRRPPQATPSGPVSSSRSRRSTRRPTRSTGAPPRTALPLGVDAVIVRGRSSAMSFAFSPEDLQPTGMHAPSRLPAARAGWTGSAVSWKHKGKHGKYGKHAKKGKHSKHGKHKHKHKKHKPKPPFQDQERSRSASTPRTQPPTGPTGPGGPPRAHRPRRPRPVTAPVAQPGPTGHADAPGPTLTTTVTPPAPPRIEVSVPTARPARRCRRPRHGSGHEAPARPRAANAAHDHADLTRGCLRRTLARASTSADRACERIIVPPQRPHRPDA